MTVYLRVQHTCLIEMIHVPSTPSRLIACTSNIDNKGEF
jgi:hypothetical protein